MRLKMTSVIVGLMTLALLAADDAPMTPLFNGKDLAGWKTPNAFWKAADGVLIGEADGTETKDLYTEKSYKDVEFETEYRLGTEADSGVNIRTPIVQVQIGMSSKLKIDKTGSLYEEGGTGGYVGNATLPDNLIKKNDWNKLHFITSGDSLKVWVNDKLVLEYNISKYPTAAPLGLQLHAGKANKIEFRNMKLKELK